MFRRTKSGLRTLMGVMLILLVGCAQAASLPSSTVADSDKAGSGASADDGILGRLAPIEMESAPLPSPDQQRIILRSATLSIVVNDPASTLSSISGIADEMGGWVVNSNTSRVVMESGEEVQRGSITIRVPAERLDEALERIKSGAGSVKSENVTGQDVTQEYTDLTSQLVNLEAAEKQLRSIMEQAEKTEDVLSVYNELVRVRGEIETTRGRIQYYDQAAAFSSISVDVIPKAIESPIQIAGWSPGRTAEEAIAALISILRSLADVLIVLVIVGVPLALVVGIPAWFIYRVLRRSRRAA